MNKAFKLGDKVRFVNEQMEGYITSIRDGKTVGVTIEDDFEIPVLVSEIIQIEERFTSKMDESKIQVATNKPENKQHPIGIFMAFERISDTELHAHIYNNLCDKALLLLYRKEEQVYQYQGSWELLRGEQATLPSTFSLEKMEKWKHWYWMILPAYQSSAKKPTAITFECTIQANEFHRLFRYAFFLQKQAFMYRIDEDLKLGALAKQLAENGIGSANALPEKVVHKVSEFVLPENGIIDIHSAKIPPHWLPENTPIILDQQLYVVLKCIEKAHIRNIEKLVFIHGVGTQLLKNKMRQLFKQHPEWVIRYEDASPILFGDGATTVFIR